MKAAKALEIIGISVVTAGIAVEVIVGADVGFLLITVGSVLVATGSMLFAKFILGRR